MAWTPEQALAWDAMWKTDIAQQGLARLKEKFMPSGKPSELPPGYDGVSLAAASWNYAQGQHNALQEIEDMKTRHTPTKLPEHFETTPRPKPQQQ